MKKITLLLSIILFAATMNAQVTGTKTIGVDYPTLAAAITDLNTVGVGAGGATINVPAGYTETAPSGGYLLGSTLLNASLGAANPLVFQKSGGGTNPLLTAFTGGSSTTSDGIFKLAGTDYVTINGINIRENPANTAGAFMEWGYALVNLNAAAPFDGCQNVTIQNCSITLDRNNPNGAFGVYSAHNVAGNNTALTLTATGDLHSNNKFYSNTISNCNEGFWILGFAAASPYTLYDQNNDVGGASAATGNTVRTMGVTALFNTFCIYLNNQNGANASYNTIDNAFGGGVSSTTQLIGIYLAGTTSNATANNNNISLLTTGGASITAAIYGANTGNMTANNNTVAFTDGGGSGTHYGIFTASVGTVSFNSNNLTETTTGGITGSIYFIYNSAAATTATINANTISNVNSSTTGTMAGIYNAGAPVTYNVTNNIISNINRTAASGTHYNMYTGSPATGTFNANTIDGVTFSTAGSTGTIYGIYDISSGVTMTYTNNIIRNFSTPGTGSLFGIREFGVTGNKTIQNNQVYNFSTSPGGAGGATMTGISWSAGGPTDDISNNRVYSMNSTGNPGGAGGTIVGIQCSSGTINNIYKNKVYDLSTNSTGGTVWGIQVTAGTTNNIYNNLIGDLRAPFVNSATDGVRGINLTTTTASSSINIYYNTIYLNASSTGANFGASGVFHTTSTTATTAQLTMRNNIIYNNSFANGTGFVTAFRRSSGAANTLNNYNAASNNNLLFAGTPSANRLIYYDGTSSAQTLAAYQAGVFTAGTIAPRDAASRTELSTPFLSTVGANANFLHISTAVATVAEGGGANIAGYADDFDGDVRNAATPDIGADEFNGIAVTACAGTPTAGSITGTNNICQGQFTILTLTGYSANSGISIQWQSSAVSGGPYAPIAGETGATLNTGVIPTGTTVYYVATVTCANGGANATTAQFAVTSNANPTVAVNPPAPTICTGGAGVALTASGAVTYSWSPAAGLSATTGATVTANPTTTTTYTVVGTNAAGCTNSATVTVTVNQSPVISTTTATPSSICLGSTSQLQVTIPAPSAYCASTHASGCGLGDEITNVVLNTLANPSGCAATAYTYFPPAGATTTTLTAGSTYNLTLSFGTDGNQYFGAWIDYNQDGTLSAGEFLGASGNAGASGTISISFTVPVGAFNGLARLRIIGGNDSPPTNGQACGASSSGFGETEDYDITIAGGVVPYTYSWSPAGTLNNSTIANPVATPTGTTTYTVTVTGGNGCTAVGSATVTVTTPIVSAVLVQPTTCVTTDGSITLTVSGGTGGVGPYSFAWVGPGVNPTSQNQVNLGVGSYTVTVTDIPSGCQFIQTYALPGPGGCNICPTIPTLATNPTPAVCQNANTTLTASGLTNMGVTYGITFKYSNVALADPYTGGTVITTVANGGLTSGGTVATANTSFPAAGNYFVYAILSPLPVDPSCRPFAQTTITVNALPTVNAVANQAVCAGSPTAAVNFTGSIPGTVYNWTNSNPAIGLAANGTGNIPSFVATNNTAAAISGTITVTPVFTGGGTTCSGTPITFTITVNPNLPLVIVAVPGTTLCQGDPAALTVYEQGPPVATTLTQSTSTAITQFNSVSCNAGGLHTDNSYWRAYNLAALGLSGPLTINTVTFGIEQAAGGTQPVTVNLYTQTTGTFPGGTRTLVGTQNFNIPNQALTLFTGAFGTPVTVPNTAVLIVELFTPSGQATGRSFFIGSNAAAQTGPSYISAAACGVAAPTDLAAIGFPNMHIILNVAGTTPGIGGIATGTFLWSPAAGLSSTTTNPVAASPAATTTYTVVRTTPAGCVGSANITININTRPTVTAHPTDVVVCATSTASFTVTGTGTGLAYQWQVSTTGAGGPWTNLANGAPYSGVTTPTLTINPVTVAMSGYRYRCVLTGICPPLTPPGNANISNGAILTVNALPNVTVTPISGCGGVAGINGLQLTASGANTYTWSPLAGLYTNPATNIPYTGTNLATVYAAPTTFTAYTVTGTNAATGCINTAIALVNYTPPAPTVTPNPVAMCLGDQPVRLISTSSVPGSCTTSSGTISVPVPDNTPNGVQSNLSVSCVPAGAIVTGISVNFNMPNHTYVGDMIFNLKAPNGTVLNLVKYMSGTATQAGTYPNSGYVNTTISSAGTASLGTATSTPITGTWKADLINGVIPFAVQDPAGFPSTASSWNALYSTPNGTWTLAMADGGPGDVGTLTSWSITINYAVGVPSTAATWTPNGVGSGLFTDPAGTIAYTGTPLDTVYTRPTPAGVYNYQVTVQSLPIPPVTVTTPMAGGNGNNLVAFNVRNGNAYPMTFTGIACNAFGSGAITARVFYSTTPIAGNPGAITAANGWTQFGTGNFNVTAGTLNQLMNNMTLVVPANTTYGIALDFTGATFPAYTNGTGAVTTYTSGGVSIITDGNVGWGGPAAPGTPANNPRNFNGSVTLVASTPACTSPARTVTVTVNTPTSVATQPVNQTICTDKVATFTVAGGGSGPFSYQWQVSTNSGNTWTNVTNGGVYSGATTTTLTISAPPVTMNNYFYRCVITGAAPCASATSFQARLTVNPLPTVVIAASPYQRLLPGLTTTLTSTVSPNAALQYTWLRNGLPVGGNTSSHTVNVDGLGTYVLRVTDVNGCTNTSNSVTIADSVSAKCFIYPNPTDGLFEVRYYSVANNTQLPRYLSVYDTKGDKLFTQLYIIGQPYNRMSVDMRRFGKGLYWVEIGDASGNRLTMCRVVIQ